MVNFNQLLRDKKRKKKLKKKRNKALCQCPFKRGVVTKLFMTSPKKPNSAKRKVCKIRIISTRRMITAGIPGIGYFFGRHSTVLIRGGRFNDVPGVNYKVLKGKLDFKWNEEISRHKSRSKYGIKIAYLNKIFSEEEKKKVIKKYKENKEKEKKDKKKKKRKEEIMIEYKNLDLEEVNKIIEREEEEEKNKKEKEERKIKLENLKGELSTMKIKEKNRIKKEKEEKKKNKKENDQILFKEMKIFFNINYKFYEKAKKRQYSTIKKINLNSLNKLEKKKKNKINKKNIIVSDLIKKDESFSIFLLEQEFYKISKKEEKRKGNKIEIKKTGKKIFKKLQKEVKDILIKREKKDRSEKIKLKKNYRLILKN